MLGMLRELLATHNSDFSAMSNSHQSTARQNSLSAASDIDDRFRVIFDAVNDGIFISNPATGRFIEVNQPGCDMFGYDKAELIGRDIEALSSGVHPYTRDMAIEWLRRASLGKPQVLEWHCKKRDDVLFWVEISIRFTEFEHAPAVIAIVRDITQRKRLDAQIVYSTQHDELTGLANRSVFTKALDRAIAQSVRSGESFSISISRSRSFQRCQRYPWSSSRRPVVAAGGGAAEANVRPSENVARFGGDEFAILIASPRESAEIAGSSEPPYPLNQ